MMFDRYYIWRIFMAVAITFLSTSLALAQIEIVTEGLVSFWTFDQSTISGDTVRDVWGDNHGTIEKAKAVGGKINQALLFNGADSYVEIPQSEDLNIVDEITIEFWFTKAGKSTENVYPRAVSKGQSTVDDGAYGVWVADQPTDIDIGFRSPGLVGGAGQNDFRTAALPDYSDGGWHYTAVVYNGEVGKIYFDGENALEIAVTGEINQSDDPLHIGDGNNQRHYNGAIDEVRIYNRALDEDEIMQNFGSKSNSVAVEAIPRLAVQWGALKAK